MSKTAVINEVGVDLIKIAPLDQDYGILGKSVAIVSGFTFTVIMVHKEDSFMPYYFVGGNDIQKVTGVEGVIILSIIINHPEWKLLTKSNPLQ